MTIFSKNSNFHSLREIDSSQVEPWSRYEEMIRFLKWNEKIAIITMVIMLMVNKLTCLLRYNYKIITSACIFKETLFDVAKMRTLKMQIMVNK
jgi:hypothetical protein